MGETEGSMAVQGKCGFWCQIWLGTLAGAAAVALAALPVRAQTASAQLPSPLLGGPTGVVKSRSGDLLEGMMVQLIAQKNNVRTTVYSNADGHYEFPRLDAGTYTLR